MQCPRLKHFVRINADGSFGCCGHMVNPPKFDSFAELESSSWLATNRLLFENNQWPKECARCKNSEDVGVKSIRQYFIEYDQRQNIENYLVVGGVLDNVCNSACQTCSDKNSTKIGYLSNKKTFFITNNTSKFWSIPQDRIVKLDISGGEPSASKNYKELLLNLPPALKEIRINTNCSNVISEIDWLVKKRIAITVTVSIDGVEKVHDYLRWPIKWQKFKKNLFSYQSIRGIKLNTWTTISALNINNFFEIEKFCKDNNIDNSYALLAGPDVLNIKYKNKFTLAAKEKFINHPLYTMIAIDKNNDNTLADFIKKQDSIRKIDINNFIDTCS